MTSRPPRVPRLRRSARDAAVLKALRPRRPSNLAARHPCCWTIIAGVFPVSALRRLRPPDTAFETAAAAASGIKAALGFAGRRHDRGRVGRGRSTFDIGFSGVSAPPSATRTSCTSATTTRRT